MSLPFQPRFIVRNIKAGFRRHGPTFPVVVLTRVVQFAYARLVGEKTFTLQGREIDHFYHLENPTFRCERSVEVGLALDAMEGVPPEDILEVGNVLANYGSFRHTVVDKYEKDVGVLNEDIVDYRPGRSFRLILCISTLEHVGWDETPREPEKLIPAIQTLKSLIAPGGTLLFTVPLGYNSFLNEAVATDRLGFDNVGFMYRNPQSGKWREADYDTVKDVLYGAPYQNANAIMVVRYRASGE